ncbi:MAG TPA: glycosyltransferase family 4 protein [Longimicrobium sp.]|nr:glycosyltransferase family 4 protein [Longimicrobium sp.]
MLGPIGSTAHHVGSLNGPAGERFRPLHLQCHGHVSPAGVTEWMKRARLFVGASLYEPFGLAPLEAVLNGCALVLSDIGSFRELWDGCAEFFPSGGAAALADALRRLEADPALRERLASAARKRALRRYTAPRMAEEYLALYRQLVAQHGRRAPSPSPEPTLATV